MRYSARNWLGAATSYTSYYYLKYSKINRHKEREYLLLHITRISGIVNVIIKCRKDGGHD
jgi:hypothetical protein